MLVACQHKPANLVQNLIISLLISTRLNSSTVQVCQKCCSVSIWDWSFLPGEYLYPHSALLFFFFLVYGCAHIREGWEEGTAPLRDKHPFLSLSWKPI